MPPVALSNAGFYIERAARFLETCNERRLPMEIQSFILCGEITPTADGRVRMFDGRVLGIKGFFPLPGNEYPMRFAMPFFILLRRDHKAYDEQCSLRFDLVDQDGHPAGQPSGFKVNAVFPAGKKFMHFSGTINFEIPAQGDYRLDITADEEGRPFVYAYNIEALEKGDEDN
jgi:hypothetical protein